MTDYRSKEQKAADREAFLIDLDTPGFEERQEAKRQAKKQVELPSLSIPSVPSFAELSVKPYETISREDRPDTWVDAPTTWTPDHIFLNPEELTYYREKVPGFTEAYAEEIASEIFYQQHKHKKTDTQNFYIARERNYRARWAVEWLIACVRSEAEYAAYKAQEPPYRKAKRAYEIWATVNRKDFPEWIRESVNVYTLFLMHSDAVESYGFGGHCSLEVASARHQLFYALRCVLETDGLDAAKRYYEEVTHDALDDVIDRLCEFKDEKVELGYTTVSGKTGYLDCWLVGVAPVRFKFIGPPAPFKKARGRPRLLGPDDLYPEHLMTPTQYAAWSRSLPPEEKDRLW